MTGAGGGAEQENCDKKRLNGRCVGKLVACLASAGAQPIDATSGHGGHSEHGGRDGPWIAAGQSLARTRPPSAFTADSLFADGEGVRVETLRDQVYTAEYHVLPTAVRRAARQSS